MVKRKRQDDKEADPFLDALQHRIFSEVAVLRALERDIDEGDTDNEAPVAPRGTTAGAGDDQPAMAQPIGDHMLMHEAGLAPGAVQTGHHVGDKETQAAAGLRARAKRDRDKRRKARKKDAGSFSLAAVSEQIAAFIEGGAGATSDALELPSFSKLQRMQVCHASINHSCYSWWQARCCKQCRLIPKVNLLQVRALACLYGLEARACGRAGQTLFKTDKSGPLTDERAAQVNTRAR